MNVTTTIHYLSFITQHHGNISSRVFHSLYGVHFLTAAVLWTCASTKDPTLQPIHILWFLYWIKSYSNIDVGSDHWQCDAKTFRKYLYKVILALFCGLDTISFKFIIFIYYF